MCWSIYRDLYTHTTNTKEQEKRNHFSLMRVGLKIFMNNIFRYHSHQTKAKVMCHNTLLKDFFS